MKWSVLCFKMRNRSAIAALAMVVLLFSFEIAQAKAKASSQKHISLDDIELDDGPEKPAVVKRASAKTDVSAQPTGNVIPDAVKSLLIEADAAEKARDYAKVISLLKPKLDVLPRSGFLQIARAYEQTHDLLAQIHALELVLAKNPKDYVVHALVGNAYLKAKRFDEAASAFGTARELNSKYRPAYEGALVLLEQSQETYEARTLVLDMIKTFGADAKLTATLCRLYSGESFVPEKSEAACHQAISVDPKNPENYVYLTMAQRDTEQKEQAFKTISSAAARFPASENVQSLAGDLKADDKNYADSYRFYAQAVRANPQSARAQVGLAKSAFELQKHSEAIESFVKACKIDRKTLLDFRQAASTLKKNKDALWMKYQDAIDDRCD